MFSLSIGRYGLARNHYGNSFQNINQREFGACLLLIECNSHDNFLTLTHKN